VPAATVAFVCPRFAHPLRVFALALASAAIMGVPGMIAGIQSDRFDQLSAIHDVRHSKDSTHG
jgi:hypothetical protein